MGVCGRLWVFVKVFGCFRMFVGVCECLWMFLDVYGCL